MRIGRGGKFLSRFRGGVEKRGNLDVTVSPERKEEGICIISIMKHQHQPPELTASVGKGSSLQSREGGHEVVYASKICTDRGRV